MRLTNLNKISALLIAGSIAVLWAFAFWATEVASFLETHKDLANPLSAALGAFLLVPLSILAGLILEGFSELTLRPFVSRSLRSHCIAMLFLQSDVWESTDKWEKAFLELAHGRPFFSRTLESIGGGISARQLAAGIFYQNATKDLVDWLLSHYATYYLATSFGLTLILFMAVPLKLFLIGAWPILTFLFAVLFLMASLYAALSLAIDRFLYTYWVTFRFAALWLEQEESKEGPNCKTKSASLSEPSGQAFP